jgi:L-lactate permease
MKKNYVVFEALARVSFSVTIGMILIMVSTEEATEQGSMLIVGVKAATDPAGNVWYLVAPRVGILDSFISGNNTVANIMFGAFTIVKPEGKS